MTVQTHAGRGKHLSEMVRALEAPGPLGSDPLITGVSSDSRQVTPGDVFVAIRGFEADGHAFIDSAVANGAVAVVLEDEAFRPRGAGSVASIRVPSSRRAVAILADEFYDHPSADLTLIGVTGTNGKTTTTLLIESILNSAGFSSGVIGTLGRGIGGRWQAADRTTPDAIELQGLLAEMRGAGITHVAMEVSSHALDLDRVYKCRFGAAVFTNLTQDHLDYHSGLDEYTRAKLELFTTYADFSDASRPMVGAVNVDDPVGEQVAKEARCRVITYGANGASQVRARSVSISADGVSFTLLANGESARVDLHLTGHFNVHNALGAAASCWGLGIDLETIVAGLGSLEAVPGRFERVTDGQDYAVIVDYAHTPNALENVLSAGRALSPTRLICVMGGGGDRDRGKRPKMGKAASDKADFTIVTSDNPRTEDPLAIIEDIAGGMTQGTYAVEPDRRQAIFRAVEMCEPGDMVIVAGKGHETYQEFDGRRIDFDDRIVARQAIAAKDQ